MSKPKMSENPFIVLGEASESDDEDFMRPTGKKAVQETRMRALEDHSSDDELSIAVGAFVSKAEEMTEVDNSKYNTLLHKKLKESNWKLREDMKSFVKSSLKYATDQINEVNQSLLSSQIETQDSVLLKRRSHGSLLKMEQTISAMLSYPCA